MIKRIIIIKIKDLPFFDVLIVVVVSSSFLGSSNEDDDEDEGEFISYKLLHTPYMKRCDIRVLVS